MHAKGDNLNGPLTLVPTPGMEELAFAVKQAIESKSGRGSKIPHTSVNIALPNASRYKNQEPRFLLADEHINGRDCVILASGPGDPEMVLNLLLTIGYVRARSARRISIVFGYFPFSRSDKDGGHLECALPSMLVNWMHASSPRQSIHKILAADPHSLQIVMSGHQGLITPVTMIRRLLKRGLADARSLNGRNICLVFPDDGANKRFLSTVRAELAELDMLDGVFIYNATKRRDADGKSFFTGLYPNGKFGFEHLNSALILSIDDEIATGGTNLDLANFLIKHHSPEEIWALATHGVLCGDAAARFAHAESPISRIYCTNTIPITPRQDQLKNILESGRFHVVPWCQDLANLILHLHWDEDIRVIR